MEFIVELTSFLRVVLACFIAIFAYEIIKYSVDCNASFIRMLFNPRLYFLSFIYKESRNLTLNGKSPKEIQEIILEKFRTKTLPFLLYPQVKQKNIDAIHFAEEVVKDLPLFEEYVCTPKFGYKAVRILKKKMKLSDEEKEAGFAISNMLNNNSEENISKCLKWFPELFIHPIPDPKNEKREIKDGENGVSIYFALVAPEKENDYVEGYSYPFKHVSIRQYIDCIQKLKRINKGMKNIKFSSTSAFENTDRVLMREDRIKAIRQFVKKNNK